MSENLAKIHGKTAMMYNGQVPWHELGQKLDGPATAAEAIKAAHLDWEVTKTPIFLKPTKKYKAISNKFAVVRTDSTTMAEVAALGIVGKTYTPLQNEEAFQWFDPIVGKGAAVYHTAGALGNGENVWILAKLPGEIRVVGDDITQKFLLLNNSHDGSSSVRVRFAPIRFACWNSLMLPSSIGNRIRVRHTSRLREQMELATVNLGVIEKSYIEIEQQFQFFAAVQMDESRLTEYLCAVFPEPTNKKNLRALRYVAKARSQSRFLFENGSGNNSGKGTRTLWAAYNGVTEFIDYAGSSGGPDQHLDSIWFGSGYQIKARAYRLALAKGELWKN